MFVDSEVAAGYVIGRKQAINRYFPHELLLHTQQHNPVLYRQILDAPTAMLGDLARQARTEKEDREFKQQLARAVANSQQPESQNPPVAPQSPPPVHKGTVSSPLGSPGPVEVPKEHERLFGMVKDVLGEDLSDHAILLGIERNVFNKVLLFPVETQRSSIKVEKADYLQKIQALLVGTRETPVSSPRGSSPTASPMVVNIPPEKKDLFDRAKTVLGGDLSDEAIALGIERNVFNMVELFPVEARVRAIEQDKDTFLRNIRTLLTPPDRGTRDPASNPYHAPQGSPRVPSDPQALPEDVRPLTNTLLRLNFTKSWNFHNAAWQLGRINANAGGQLDHPELLKMLDTLMQKITASAEYKGSPGYYEVMKDAAEKLADSRFRERMLLQLGQQQPVSEPPSQPQPARVSPQTAPQRSPVAPIPVSVPVRPQQTVVELVGPRHQLSPANMRILSEVFGDSQNEEEVENALTACDYLHQQGSLFPFEFLLSGLKRHPEEAKKIASFRAGSDPAMNKRIAEPFLRQCVLDYAQLNGASENAKKHLTTVNLWYQRDLLEQVIPLRQMNDLYQALNGKPMTPDELTFALADNMMTSLVASRLEPFIPVQPLMDIQQHSEQHPDIRAIARALDGSEQLPSTKAISVCNDVARYASGAMKSEEYQRKKDDIDKCMDEISYSWVQHYLDRPVLLQTFIDNTIQPRLSVENNHTLATAFRKWIAESQYNKGVQFMETLPPAVRRDLRIVYEQLGVANLQNFGKQLLEYEPFVSGAVHAQHFKANVELGLDFMGKGDQEKVSAKFRELGVKTGQRTIADGNCGFASIGMMTGDSPMQVRANARKVALDMQELMDHGAQARIDGDHAYQRRVRTAVKSFREKEWIETLKQPGERAELVGIDPNSVDFTREKRFNPDDLWMSDEDRQYVAVYYGRPVMALAEVDEGDLLFGKYITAEGELKYAFDDNFYEDGKATARQINPPPLIVINMGNFAFAHWMPTEPVPFPRRKLTRQTPPQQRDHDDLETSIRQNKQDREQFLAGLMLNPELIPAGQTMLPRPESPKYYDSLGSSSLGLSGTIHAQRRQLLEDLKNDPMQSLQIGGIGPEAGKYQHLTRMQPTDNTNLPDMEQSLTSLSIQPSRVEQLPHQNAGRTPGFRNFGNRTCFCNAGLKQQIAGMTMADVKDLQDRAYTLKRNHPGVYDHKYQTSAYGEKSQVRDGGKRADLMLSFAGLAEATLRARSGLKEDNIEERLWSVHEACYQLGQSQDIDSSAFRRYYPHGSDQNFTGSQWDSQEFIGKLLEIVDEDSHLSNPVSQGYVIQTTDGSNYRKERVCAAQNIMTIPIDGQSLENCMSRKTRAMEQQERLTLSDGNKHAADKTDFFVHPQPRAVHKLNIQAQAFTWDRRTNQVLKLTNEARNLVLKHPFEQIRVPLVNETSKQTEHIPMQIKSIVAHIGTSADAGHYVTYEKQGDQWYLYDDSHTRPVDLTREFGDQLGMIPYIFQYESVNRDHISKTVLDAAGKG